MRLAPQLPSLKRCEPPSLAPQRPLACLLVCGSPPRSQPWARRQRPPAWTASFSPVSPYRLSLPRCSRVAPLPLAAPKNVPVVLLFSVAASACRRDRRRQPQRLRAHATCPAARSSDERPAFAPWMQILFPPLESLGAPANLQGRGVAKQVPLDAGVAQESEEGVCCRQGGRPLTSERPTPNTASRHTMRSTC